MNESPALELRDLRKVYSSKAGEPLEALRGVSLTIDRGEFFALLGPNGAGKTTIISILAGLTQKTAGTVLVMGASLDTELDTAKAYIGLVPQEFNFNMFETVEDIVINQAGYYGMPRREAAARATVLLKELGLSEKAGVQARTLSGGMKRRLMIARALIHDPKVLLLDEPTAGVDVEMRRGMWDFLRALNARGTTIVLTTHYLEEAEQLCSRVAIINKGEIIEEGSVKSLLTKLNFVTLIMEITDPVTKAQMQLLRDFPIQKIDDHTLEVRLSPGETINDTVRQCSKVGIQIANIRNNGSRLEEVFVHLIDKK